MTKRQEYKQLEESLLTDDQLRELHAFDEQVRCSNIRFNGMATCESDLGKDEFYEYKNFSLE